MRLKGHFISTFYKNKKKKYTVYTCKYIIYIIIMRLAIDKETKSEDWTQDVCSALHKTLRQMLGIAETDFFMFF